MMAEVLLLLGHRLCFGFILDFHSEAMDQILTRTWCNSSIVDFREVIPTGIAKLENCSLRDRIELGKLKYGHVVLGEVLDFAADKSKPAPSQLAEEGIQCACS